MINIIIINNYFFDNYYFFDYLFIQVCDDFTNILIRDHENIFFNY